MERRLVGYSPWGHKESDTTEQLALWGKGAILSNKASGGGGGRPHRRAQVRGWHSRWLGAMGAGSLPPE